MTDTFYSFKRNVTFVTCFLLPNEGSIVIDQSSHDISNYLFSDLKAKFEYMIPTPTNTLNKDACISNESERGVHLVTLNREF